MTLGLGNVNSLRPVSFWKPLIVCSRRVLNGGQYTLQGNSVPFKIYDIISIVLSPVYCSGTNVLLNNEDSFGK